MDDYVMVMERTFHQGRITNVPFDKMKSGIIGELGEVGRIAGISEFV
jgi:hypothetical protein